MKAHHFLSGQTSVVLSAISWRHVHGRITVHMVSNPYSRLSESQHTLCMISVANGPREKHTKYSYTLPSICTYYVCTYVCMHVCSSHSATFTMLPLCYNQWHNQKSFFSPYQSYILVLYNYLCKTAKLHTSFQYV